MKTLKTLVIHPDDRSTDFLKPIYENIADKTVITGGVSYEEVKQLIREHDRVIMLGHGSPYGLFACHKFTDYPRWTIIDDGMVEVLREKEENIYIWCYAKNFVEFYGLKGVCSGMFISEVGEARGLGVHANQKIVDESNDTFAEILGGCVNGTKDEIFDTVVEKYGVLAETNNVAKYNIKKFTKH
jgi:hypothetical protein